MPSPDFCKSPVFTKHYGTSGLARDDSLSIAMHALQLPEGTDMHVEMLALPGHADGDSLKIVKRVIALPPHGEGDSVKIHMRVIDEEVLTHDYHGTADGDSLKVHMRILKGDSLPSTHGHADEEDSEVLMVYSKTALDTIVHRKAMVRLQQLDSTLTGLPIHARAALFAVQTDSSTVDYSLPAHISVEKALHAAGSGQYERIVIESTADTLAIDPSIIQKTIVVHAPVQPQTRLGVAPDKTLTLNGKAIALDDLALVLGHLHNPAPQDSRIHIHDGAGDAQLLGKLMDIARRVGLTDQIIENTQDSDN
ncbi:MAG: hypothetical protein GKR89_36985 [Candidatus Latescibacteria bacterium]|nr:hypothetical protein [Candidatus Latescibacterota bacterium]